MANRGRGRGGRAMPAINVEQLGIEKGDPPPPVLQPPPKHPLLEYKAPPFQPNAGLSYLWELKRDFAETMQESPNHVHQAIAKKDIERYSDRYARSITSDQLISWDQRYDWTMLPRELMPAAAKRKARDLKTAEKAKKLKIIDVDKKLQELEQKENTSKGKESDVDEEANEDDEDKEQDENADDENGEADYEMDDETDYQNNYFDNGEEYGDEDDNIDNGPTYG